MGFESIPTRLHPSVYSGKGPVDSAGNDIDTAYPSNTCLERSVGNILMNWRISYGSERSRADFDEKMLRIVRQAVLWREHSGYHAGRIVYPQKAYAWTIEKWQSTSKESSNTEVWAFRDWISKQFSPESYIPNPYLAAYELKKAFSDANVEGFMEKTVPAIEAVLQMKGECIFRGEEWSGGVNAEIPENLNVSEESFEVSDGYLLNVTRTEFFDLLQDVVEEDGDGFNEDLDSEIFTYWIELDRQRLTCSTKEVLKRHSFELGGQMSVRKRIIKKLAGGPGRTSKFIGNKIINHTERTESIGSFKSAAHDVALLKDVVQINPNDNLDSKVKVDMEEELWMQIGMHYGLDTNVLEIVRQHPEARSAIARSMKLAPIYWGQRTLVGWPAWVGLIGIFENNNILKSAVQLDGGIPAIMGAATTTYFGATMKSMIHKDALNKKIGSPDLIGTFWQIKSIAEDGSLSMKEHAGVGARSAKYADLLWIGWPISLLAAYKLGHATEYLLSANINYAIEAMMIRWYKNKPFGTEKAGRVE